MLGSPIGGLHIAGSSALDAPIQSSGYQCGSIQSE
jgi:hypothetical protein